MNRIQTHQALALKYYLFKYLALSVMILHSFTAQAVWTTNYNTLPNIGGHEIHIDRFLKIPSEVLADRSRVEFYKDPRSWYNVVSLFLEEDESPVSPHHVFAGKVPDYVPRLTGFLQDWILFQFDFQGIAVKGSERYEGFRTHGNLHDGRSAYVFITEQNNLYGIKAILRIARTGNKPETQKLPVENHLRIDLPRPTLEIGPLRNGYQYYYGDAVELKNFFHVRDAEEDFIPLLFDRAFNYDFFNRVTRIGTVDGKKVRILPSVYYIHCDMSLEAQAEYLKLKDAGVENADLPEIDAKTYKDKMVMLYKNLGAKFHLADPDSKSYVFVMTHKDIEKLPEIFAKRPGQALLRESGHQMGPQRAMNHGMLRGHAIRPFDCEEMLTLTQKKNPTEEEAAELPIRWFFKVFVDPEDYLQPRGLDREGNPVPENDYQDY